jgi:uncharacterized protein YhaN
MTPLQQHVEDELVRLRSQLDVFKRAQVLLEARIASWERVRRNVGKDIPELLDLLGVKLS